MSERKIKTYKGEYYSLNSILGNDWSLFYCLLGGRACGKSYSVMRHICNRKLKLGDQCKLYWLRLTDAAADNLLKDGGAKLVDPDLKRKYNIEHTMRKNHTIYTYNEVVRTTKTGREVKEKTNIKEFCEVLSCSTFGNTKGVGYFDNEYVGEYWLVLDEMNREKNEKNSFNIVYNFANLIENLVRTVKQKVKIIMIGNTLSETSDILTAFNFIPESFGRYKLKSKRCVIDYIMPNEQYKEQRKGSAADILAGNSSTFTNETMIDRSLLCNKRLCYKPRMVVKFDKDPSTWFTVWNDNIIQKYNKEQCINIVAMSRYLDEKYNSTLIDMVIDNFDNRRYKFTNLSYFKEFEMYLKLNKKK